jgi:hypothetical protein
MAPVLPDAGERRVAQNVRMRRAGRRVPVVTSAAVLLLLLAGCVAAPRSAAPSRTLPADLSDVLLSTCLIANGISDPGRFGIELSGGAGGRIVIRPRNGYPEAIAAARGVQGCVDRYPLARVWAGTPTTVQLNQLYDYYAGVLWPCLAAHDVHAGPIPDRRVMFEKDHDPIDPYLGPAMSGVGLDDARAIAAACPSAPSYLPAGFIR